MLSARLRGVRAIPFSSVLVFRRLTSSPLIAPPSYFLPFPLILSSSLYRTGLAASSSSCPSAASPHGSVFPCSRSVSGMASQSSAPKQNLHDFTVKDVRGNDVELSKYKGKTLLLVNVASQCGLTDSNYKELNQLYDKYKDQGLEILAFPCNQFGGQEPGTNEQIEQVVCTRFKAEFPVFDKVEVNGEKTAPVYKFLKSSKGGMFGDSIKWNFTKFLVDQEGHVIDRYAPTTSPLSIEKDIKKVLGVS
ncbi:probable phospholipid hydroperoxide glutathione peroxidase [Nymphaea colorata]|nr:probable phospholipid hydroperoxide glutathione peroxidase [Nymphaea colorata]